MSRDIVAPSGYSAIVSFYSWDPRIYLLEDGRVSHKWEDNLVIVDLPEFCHLSWPPYAAVHRIRFHKACAPVWDAAFKAVHAAGLWKALEVFGGAYVFRTKRTNGGQLSMHAFGAAADFDPLKNKLGSHDHAMPEAVVEIMEGEGLAWGGRWDNPDSMHFQFGGDY